MTLGSPRPHRFGVPGPVTPRPYPRGVAVIAHLPAVGSPAPPPYGLDIETDTSVNGLDPRLSRVTAIGVAGDGWRRAFTGTEAEVLTGTDRFLAELEPGLLVTWNGAAFDLPFLADRALVAGVRLGLRVRPDGDLIAPRSPLPGHSAAYRGGWWGHGHTDAYRELRRVAHGFGLSAGLKPFARLHGIDCVEEDRTDLHSLDDERIGTYVASDAAATRSLALLYRVA